MKVSITLGQIVVLIFTLQSSHAQKFSEVTQPLTSEAQKGFIDDVKIDQGGKIHVVYRNKLEKNSAEIDYEDYAFDPSLKFIGKEKISLNKEVKPDKEERRLGAYVGGGPKCTSFDVLSMKIRVVTYTRKYSDWDYRKQRYKSFKDGDKERGKIKSDEDKPYYGVESYWRDDTGTLALLAYSETKDKKNPKKYVLLDVDFDGNVKEKVLDINGNYSLVYSQEISEEQSGKAVGKQDLIVIFAPKDGSPNVTDYVYLHYDMAGNLKNKITFPSPSSNLLISNATVIDGSVFLFGQSTKSKKAYNEVFEDYSVIQSPCFKASGGDAENFQMSKYLKAANEEMDFFHILKMAGSKMEFASTTSIDGIKSKMKTPPNSKGATPYKGKKFVINKFEITPNNEYLIAGQLVTHFNTVSVGGYVGDVAMYKYGSGYRYGDIVCIHVDAKGNLKAQYAVDKVYESKEDRAWPMEMTFFFTPDGKYAYWEILEVKAVKDKSYWATVNSFYGVDSYYPRYFPRIGKINLENQTIGDFTDLGNRKYFIYPGITAPFNPSSRSKIYFGKNNDESTLWIGKIEFE
jgi:hypothetical protein